MTEQKADDIPQNARAFYDKGITAMERDNLDYAMDMFTAALAVDPASLPIRKLLREAGIRNSRKEKGKKFSTLSGGARLLKIAAQRKSNPLVALEEAEKLMRLDPFNIRFITALCDAAEAADLPNIAIQTMEIARQHHPDDIQLLERTALLYRKTGQYTKEHDCWEIIVKKKPNDGKALKALKDAAAQTTMEKAGWNRADSFRDVMKDDAESRRIEHEQQSVKSSDSLQELIDSNLEKIQSEPENINYRRALADLYLRAQKFDSAIETLDACRRIAGNADPQIDRARSEAVQKKFETEIETAKNAGETETAVQKQAELDAFRLKDAEERVERYPNDLQFKYDLGILRFEHGEYTEAIQLFQQSQRNPQRRIHSLLHMALCFKEKGQLDIAAEQLERAREENPVMDETKKNILYELGTIHEAMGRTTDATGFYKEIYAVDIGYRDVAEKVEKAYN